MTQPVTDDRANNDEVTPWPYLNVLLRRRWIIVLVPSILALIVGALSSFSSRQYIATAAFVPVEPSTQQGSLGVLASQLGLSVPRGATTSPEFYAGLLQSRDVLADVLLTRYTAGGFDGSLLTYFGLSGQGSDDSVIAGIRHLRDIITVRTNRSTGVVTLEVATTVRPLSPVVARRFLELLNDYNLQRRQSIGRAEREFVEERLRLAQDSLAVAEEQLARFYARNRRFSDSPELVADEGRLQRRVAQRQQIYLSLSQSYEAAKIEEVRNTPVITLVDRPEGSVEPKARGTAYKVVGTLFLAGLFVILLAFVLEAGRRARQTKAEGYEEFQVLRKQALADLGRLVRRRAG